MVTIRSVIAPTPREETNSTHQGMSTHNIGLRTPAHLFLKSLLDGYIRELSVDLRGHYSNSLENLQALLRDYEPLGG
jgi:hypothetical protein